MKKRRIIIENAHSTPCKGQHLHSDIHLVYIAKHHLVQFLHSQLNLCNLKIPLLHQHNSLTPMIPQAFWSIHNPRGYGGMPDNNEHYHDLHTSKSNIYEQPSIKNARNLCMDVQAHIYKLLNMSFKTSFWQLSSGIHEPHKHKNHQHQGLKLWKTTNTIITSVNKKKPMRIWNNVFDGNI